MALSFVKYPGDGVQTQWTVTPVYIAKSHITVFVDDVSVPFVWVNNTLIQTTTAAADQSVVAIRRDTPISAPLVDFEDGGTLAEPDLDLAVLQALFLAQEQADDIDNSIGLAFDEEWDAENKPMKNLADPASPTSLTDAINIGFLNTALVGSGNVPVPLDPSEDGMALIAGSGLWSWAAMLVANISDIVAVMKTFLKSADLATARTNLGLGSAAVLNDGTGAGDLPLNSDLGSASLIDTGTSSGEIPLLDGVGMPAVSANQMTFSALINALNENKGNNIASVAGVTDIGAATGNFVDVTGTNTITGFGTVTAGTERTVRFTGVLTITHNGTSLICLGGANVLTVVNDIGVFRSLGSGNWVMVDYIRKTGRPLKDNVNGDKIGDVKVFETTVGFGDVDSAGEKTLIAAGTGVRWNIRDIMLSGGGTNWATGDRLLDITDGSSIYSVIPAATLQSLAAARWGDTGVAFPATASHMTAATGAGDDLVAKHSGGATDYDAGSLTIMVVAQRVA